MWRSTFWTNSTQWTLSSLVSGSSPSRQCTRRRTWHFLDKQHPVDPQFTCLRIFAIEAVHKKENLDSSINDRTEYTRTREQVILLNVAKCELAFYAVYYTISSLTFALYRLDRFDGKIPFDFETWVYLPDCCNTLSATETVNFISMEVSFAVSGLIFGVMVRERVWDYALTVTVVHTALSCLVMLKFPLNWSWWVCCALALLLMITIGELVGFVVRWKFQSKVNPAPKEVNGNDGFLFRKS
ncbi:hypothetical protein ACOMHN_002331 [Nucella lapillus]